MKRTLPLLIIGLVLVASILGAWYWRRSSAKAPLSVPQTTPRQQQARPGNPKTGATPPHMLGNEDAPVMLEEFADFQCGGCAAVHPVMKAMHREFGSKVVIVFREYPLPMHKHATTAARAAEAAGLQGKFWEMYDELFVNQKLWDQAADVGPIFREYATKIGLDVDRFQRDLSSAAVNQRITADRERAAWIGVNSTPTVFLNGREVPFDSLTTDKLRTLIRTELSSPETRKN